MQFAVLDSEPQAVYLHCVAAKDLMRILLTTKESEMSRRLSTCLVLSVFVISLASAQAGSRAATRNTWHVASQFGMYYALPIDEGEYVEEGALMLDVNPRVLWFPVDGLGVGIDAGFYYFTGHFTDFSLGIGPRVAYYLRRPGQKSQLMPHVGCSFQYVLNDVDPGASETGWNLKLGLGVSPVIGGHVAVPVELGYILYHRSSDYGEENYSHTAGRIYLESGIGAFLWKK